MPTYFFSKSGEDAILYNLLYNKLHDPSYHGRYVDVGAHHPFIHSNTFFFYLNGWRGINVEPNPYMHDLLEKKRKGDINVNVAIDEENGKGSFFIYSRDSSANSLSESFVGKKASEKIEVSIWTLTKLFETHWEELGHVDLLSVDAEGKDLAVLMSNDWNRFRPTYIVVEAHLKYIEDLESIGKDLYQFLKLQNYAMVAKTCLIGKTSNLIFEDRLAQNS
ncbi:MAG: FkbM family methyltransferase [Bacteroidota bacterium]